MLTTSPTWEVMGTQSPSPTPRRVCRMHNDEEITRLARSMDHEHIMKAVQEMTPDRCPGCDGTNFGYTGDVSKDPYVKVVCQDCDHVFGSAIPLAPPMED